MRGNYIKHNSHTQQDAKVLAEAKTKVLRYAKMTYEQHEDLMFEYGCRFVETSLKSDSDRMLVLTNPGFRFWPWWRITWAKDDDGLIVSKCFSDNVDYAKMKACMITSPMLKNQLINLLAHA